MQFWKVKPSTVKETTLLSRCNQKIIFIVIAALFAVLYFIIILWKQKNKSDILYLFMQMSEGLLESVRKFQVGLKLVVEIDKYRKTSKEGVAQWFLGT